jgi:asparagine synthase (glutamine-hydrolysing)
MVIEHLPAIIGRTLEPLGGLGTFGLAMKYRAATEHGYRVMLSGEGADDLFGGYTYHRRVSNSLGPNSPVELPNLTVRASDGTLLGQPSLHRGFAYTSPVVDFGTPAETASLHSKLRRDMWADMVALRLPKLLRFRDRMSMLHGIEARVPFLDAAVLRASLNLADRHLVRGPSTKAILRDVASAGGFGRFAVEKFGNPAPQREWIKGSLGAWIDGLIDGSMLVKSGIIDGPGFRRQLAVYRSSAELGNSFFAWQFANLELWMRAFESRRTNGRLAVQQHQLAANHVQSKHRDAVLGSESSTPQPN